MSAQTSFKEIHRWAYSKLTCSSFLAYSLLMSDTNSTAPGLTKSGGISVTLALAIAVVLVLRIAWTHNETNKKLWTNTKHLCTINGKLNQEIPVERARNCKHNQPPLLNNQPKHKRVGKSLKTIYIDKRIQNNKLSKTKHGVMS